MSFSTLSPDIIRLIYVIQLDNIDPKQSTKLGILNKHWRKSIGAQKLACIAFYGTWHKPGSNSSSYLSGRGSYRDTMITNVTLLANGRFSWEYVDSGSDIDPYDKLFWNYTTVCRGMWVLNGTLSKDSLFFMPTEIALEGVGHRKGSSHYSGEEAEHIDEKAALSERISLSEWKSIWKFVPQKVQPAIVKDSVGKQKKVVSTPLPFQSDGRKPRNRHRPGRGHFRGTRK